jgi:enoyl-CoA hydratase
MHVTPKIGPYPVRMGNTVKPFPLHRERSGPFAGIATIFLEQAPKPVVVLDHDLIRRLDATLSALPRDLRGLVLASSAPRAFVAGADLKSIAEMSDDQLHRYLAYASSVYIKLSVLPYPTVAAINGATLGGGLELAMHCDGLVAAPAPKVEGVSKPYPVGLPEAGLAICPGWGGTCLLPARMKDPAAAIVATATGKPMMLDDAVKAGMFDRVASEAEQLLPTAKQWLVEQADARRVVRDGAPLRHVGRTNIAAKVVVAMDSVRDEVCKTDAGKAVAMAIDAGLTKGFAACLKVEQAQLVRLRNLPAAKEAIAAFFAKKK